MLNLKWGGGNDMHVNPLHLFHLRNDVILKCHFTAPITFVDLIVLEILS